MISMPEAGSVPAPTPVCRPTRICVHSVGVCIAGLCFGMASKMGLGPSVAALVLIAAFGAAGWYLFVPYEPGPWHQVWTVTVSDGPRTAASSGFGLGRCGDEGPNGATTAKQGALGRACFAVRMCPGDAVCDCSARAQVQYRCAMSQTAGRTRAADMIRVPVH